MGRRIVTRLELRADRVEQGGCVAARADKVAQAIAAGRLWRAKEILGSRIRAQPFDAALYERYGQVLLGMGDHLEAGKFLLLSGVRAPEYTAPIELFVRRYSGGRWQHIFATLPRGARRCSWSALPAQARADLEAIGVPVRSSHEPVSSALPPRGPDARLSWFLVLVVLTILAAVGFVVAVFIVHFYYE
jgi:hypothetical protein